MGVGSILGLSGFPDDDTEVIESGLSIEIGIDPAAYEISFREMSSRFMVMDRGIFKEDILFIIADGDDVMAVFEFWVLFLVAPCLDGADHGDLHIETLFEVVQGEMFLGGGMKAEVSGHTYDILVTGATFIRAEDADEFVFLVGSDSVVLADSSEGSRTAVKLVALFDFGEMDQF